MVGPLFPSAICASVLAPWHGEAPRRGQKCPMPPRPLPTAPQFSAIPVVAPGAGGPGGAGAL